MSITVIKSPDSYSFCGNPMIFELLSSTADPLEIELTVEDQVQHLTYFPDQEGKIRFDIADFCKRNTEITLPEGQFVTPVTGLETTYTVRVSDYEQNGIAFQGGISSYNHRILQKNGYNIFSYRLTQPFQQFLFTTRTNGRSIRLQKTELYPFVFIHPGLPIVFKSETGYTVETQAEEQGTVCAMDIRAVWNQMPAGTRYVHVCIDGQDSFHFDIHPGTLSEEKYIIKFKNSFGTYELLEVTGRAMIAPEFSGEIAYLSFTKYNFFEDKRLRVKTKGVIDVETGYKKRSDFPFILDLIKSDECYFYYPDGEHFRCHVTSDQMQYRNLITEPASVKLKIKELIEEEYISERITIREENVKYLLSYDLDDGEIANYNGGTPAGSYLPGTTITMPTTTPSKEGDFFIGWKRSDTDDMVLPGHSFSMPAHHVVLAAQWGEAINTDIEFEVSIDEENVNTPVSLLRISASDSIGLPYRIDYGDGTTEYKSFTSAVKIESTDEQGQPLPSNDPNYWVYWMPDMLYHTYTSMGKFTVTVHSNYHIFSAQFSTKSQQQIDPVASFDPVPHITQINKFLSDSINSLGYTFAGMTNCVPQEGFILETPSVVNMDGAFRDFGREIFCFGTGENERTRPEDMWAFDSNLLSQLTLVTQLRFTFFGCMMNHIPVGFLDALTGLTTCYETWKHSNLGTQFHDGVTRDWLLVEELLGDLIPDNTSGREFIPHTLFHKAANLKSVKSIFNALNITNRGRYRYGFPGEGAWGGNWWEITGFIRAELLWNGKDVGNARGTIEDMSFFFYNSNIVVFEKDFFRYVKDSLTNISGAFQNYNWPVYPYMLCQEYYLSDISACDPDNSNWCGGLWQEQRRGLNNLITHSARNIQDMLGDNTFPKITLAIAAFRESWKNDPTYPTSTSQYGMEDNSNGVGGFNGIINGLSRGRIPLDNNIMPHFPNIMRSPGQWEGVNYNTGFDGMLWGLWWPYHDEYNVLPDADHLIALTVNVHF
ncbi:MAG: hypothetical protein LBG15_07975 [Dysgonamonadaceae bacterium]|jgi:hypothetical protein|nr:hypothetical protein [Dysgonamonadaceae bacterium]